MSSKKTSTENESIPLEESIKGDTTASSDQSVANSEDERKKRRRHSNKVSSRKARIRQKVHVEQLQKHFASLREQSRLLKQENSQLHLLRDTLWRLGSNNTASGQFIGAAQLSHSKPQQYQAMPQRSTSPNLTVTNNRRA